MGKQTILTETRAAYTAEGRAPSAVVCLAFEDDPAHVPQSELGTFETWTQANAVATALNRILGIDDVEAGRIVIGSMLAKNHSASHS